MKIRFAVPSFIVRVIDAIREPFRFKQRELDARAWEREKARDIDWLKARIHDAGYPCMEVTRAFPKLYGGESKSVQVICDKGKHRYAISEDTVNDVG